MPSYIELFFVFFLAGVSAGLDPETAIRVATFLAIVLYYGAS